MALSPPINWGFALLCLTRLDRVYFIALKVGQLCCAGQFGFTEGAAALLVGLGNIVGLFGGFVAFKGGQGHL